MLKESESNINPVFQLMKDRKLEKSKVWDRTDGQKLGVVIEGGSHRAVVSAAFLLELLAMGYRDSIDVLYGESVGACNGAVFASGQLPEAIKTYWQLVNNLAFINPLRIAIGRPMVDINFFMTQLEKYLSLRYLRKFNPEIADYYAKVRARFRETMQFLRQKQITHDGPPYVAVLTLPKGSKRLSTFEIREKALVGMAQKAQEATRQTLK